MVTMKENTYVSSHKNFKFTALIPLFIVKPPVALHFALYSVYYI